MGGKKALDKEKETGWPFVHVEDSCGAQDEEGEKDYSQGWSFIFM